MSPRAKNASTRTARAARAFTRRTLLRGATAAATAAAMGPWVVRDAFSSSGEVHVIVWTGYLPNDLIADFTKATGIKAHVSPLGSNEELINKMKATKGRGFDVISPTLNRRGQWIDLKLTQPWDLKRINSLNNVEPSFINASQAWTWDGGQHHLRTGFGGLRIAGRREPRRRLEQARQKGGLGQ